MTEKTITMVLQRNPMNNNDLKQMREGFMRGFKRYCGEFGEVTLKTILNYGGRSAHCYFVFELTITDAKAYNIAKLKNSRGARNVAKLHNQFLRVENKLSDRKYVDISHSL